MSLPGMTNLQGKSVAFESEFPDNDASFVERRESDDLKQSLDAKLTFSDRFGQGWHRPEKELLLRIVPSRVTSWYSNDY